MNSHIWKCSQCDKHTKMNIKDDIIDINCKCGYQSTMKIKEYINPSQVATWHFPNFHIFILTEQILLE